MKDRGNDDLKLFEFQVCDIEDYLRMVHAHIASGHYQIQPRFKNKVFMEDYQLDSKKTKSILLGLTYRDFCYAVRNEKEVYAHEVLYIFSKELTLLYFGERKRVKCYIKINRIEMSPSTGYVFVVSLHELAFPIQHLFK